MKRRLGQLISSIIAVLLFGAASWAAPDPLFTQNCAVCHGADATGGDRGPALANSRRLRTQSAADIATLIRNGTLGGMPAFPLPEDQITQLAGYVHSLNATAFQMKPDGDLAAGETFFWLLSKKCNCA
jgi:mono/diheme cytochrome c family protein